MNRIICLMGLMFAVNTFWGQCPTSGGPNRTVCASIYGGQGIQIGPSSPNLLLSYSWSPSTSLSETNVPNPYAMPNETTTYTLTVSGGSCGTLQFAVTVKVLGYTYVTNPNGTKSRVRSTYNIYYPYEASDTLRLSNEDPNAVWWLVDNYNSTINYNAGSGLTYNLPFTGLGDNNYTPVLVSYDDQNNECYDCDQPQIITHGVYSNGYPVTVTGNYYAYSACGPTLSSTINQVASIAGNTPTYEWTLQGANSSYWSITSPSSNAATLNRSGGTPPVSNDIYTRAYTGSSPIGQHIEGAEVWMRWGVGYHAGAYPTCYPVSSRARNIPNEDLTQNVAKLMPNPSNSIVTVSSSNVIHKIIVYNALGLQVKQFSVNNASTYTVDIKSLKAGYYVVSVYSEKGIETLKLIKQ